MPIQNRYMKKYPQTNYEKNEEILRQNIKDLLNDTILSDSRIRDVRFTQLDVTQQY